MAVDETAQASDGTPVVREDAGCTHALQVALFKSYRSSDDLLAECDDLCLKIVALCVLKSYEHLTSLLLFDAHNALEKQKT